MDYWEKVLNDFNRTAGLGKQALLDYKFSFARDGIKKFSDAEFDSLMNDDNFLAGLGAHLGSLLLEQSSKNRVDDATIIEQYISENFYEDQTPTAMSVGDGVAQKIEISCQRYKGVIEGPLVDGDSVGLYSGSVFLDGEIVWNDQFDTVEEAFSEINGKTIEYEKEQGDNCSKNLSAAMMEEKVAEIRDEMKNSTCSENDNKNYKSVTER